MKNHFKGLLMMLALTSVSVPCYAVDLFNILPNRSNIFEPGHRTVDVPVGSDFISDDVTNDPGSVLNGNFQAAKMNHSCLIASGSFIQSPGPILEAYLPFEAGDNFNDFNTMTYRQFYTDVGRYGGPVMIRDQTIPWGGNLSETHGWAKAGCTLTLYSQPNSQQQIFSLANGNADAESDVPSNIKSATCVCPHGFDVELEPRTRR